VANKKPKILNQKEISDQLMSKYNVDYSSINSALFEKSKENILAKETFSGKSYSYWRNVGTKLITNWLFIVSLVMIIGIIIIAIVCSWGQVAVPDVNSRPGDGPEGPSAANPFGLGLYGEDYWTECWLGTRYTLMLTLGIVVIQIVVGLILGSIWGFFKKSDIFFINVANIINLMPSLVFILVFISLFGIGFWPILLSISLQSWIGFAMATRVQILIIRNREYNIMSDLLGTSKFKIITKNILPKIAPIIVSIGAFAIPDAISIDTSISYLHFGFVDGTETTSLGYIVQNIISRTEWMSTPSLILFPVLIIIVIAFFFFMLCSKFASALNPKSHAK